MDSVKRAQKTMMLLAIIPGCLCVVGLGAYFTTDSGSHGLGLLAGWTCFSAAIVQQAQRAIRTLEEEIESLKLGGSEVPAATERESLNEPADE